VSRFRTVDRRPVDRAVYGRASGKTMAEQQTVYINDLRAASDAADLLGFGGCQVTPGGPGDTV
jgi:hypothetical protein